MVSLQWHIHIISKVQGTSGKREWRECELHKGVESCGTLSPRCNMAIVPAATLVEGGPAQDGPHRFPIMGGGLGRTHEAMLQSKIYRQLTAVGKISCPGLCMEY